MKITDYNENGITVYVLEGRIDGEGANILSTTLQAGIETGQTKMVLNMAQTQYINSVALRTLAEVSVHNREANGDLKLVALPPSVKRVFQIVGFDKFSSIYDTLEAALADF